MTRADRMTCAEAIALAKQFAARGIHAFPIAIGWDKQKQSTNKRPLTEHGHLDATTNPAELEPLFNARSPKPGEVWGVGLWPGPSNHLVLDPDIKSGHRGDDELAALEAEHGKLDTLRAVTASGGGHVWLTKPPGTHIGNDDLVTDEVEVRSDDGWAVAIGVWTPWGSWDHDQATPKRAAPAPAWLLDKLASVSTNGDGGGAKHWRKFTDTDAAGLNPADAAALELLTERFGAHSPHWKIDREGGEWLQVSRPGKAVGGSASIGYIGPGVVKVFTTDWPPFKKNGVYDVDHLRHLANGNQADSAPKQHDAATSLRLVRASTIKLDRPRWVWERRIPVGGTTLMAGREGMGKTALFCWLAGQLTRGELPGEWRGRPADVVYIGHEDDRATVLNPRLTAAGADLDRFHFVDVDEAGFTVATDVAELSVRLHGQPVALVGVDPLDAHLGAQIDSNRDKARVQATIRRLADLAQELRCGVIGLGHLNKAAITDLLAKVVGSVGFTTSVRSVLAVGEHPDDQTEKVCVLAKANMTDRSTVPAIRFRVEGATVDHPDDPSASTPGASPSSASN